MKILFTGGGSGGHIFPIIAVIREIKRIMPEVELVYLGPRDEWVALHLAQEDIKIKKILAGKVRRYFSPSAILLNFFGVFLSFFGFFQSLFSIFFINPDLIFSKGGYGSIIVVLAGKILGIPIFIHESDISPGFSNRFASKLALEIFTSFSNTEYFAQEKTIAVGNPLRREIFGGSEETSKELFKLTGEKPVIFILGGSQGAERINDLILLAAPQLLEKFEIIHQCGEKNFARVSSEAKVVAKGELAKYYHPLGFLHESELKEAFFSADVIVSRAGSGSIFNTAALGKPSILIPLPESAQNHQFKNAYAFAEKGACLVIEEINLSHGFFLERLDYLTSHSEEMEKMKEAAKNFARPLAAKVIAQYLLEYLLK